MLPRADFMYPKDTTLILAKRAGCAFRLDYLPSGFVSGFIVVP
jgi:hypothetical protein